MNKYFSSIRFGLTTFSSIVLIGLLFSACKKSSNDVPDTPVAGLMAFNLATDKGAVGFALTGNQLTNSPLGYTNFTGGYLPIYTGNRTAESYDYNSGSVIASSGFSFEADKYYSIFLLGANGNYRNIISRDNFDSLSSSAGSAYIRYINAIPDSSKPVVSIVSGGVSAVNESAGFAGVSEFKAVTPGSITIAVNNSGTIQANRTITVEQRKLYTVLLSGIPGSTDTTRSVQIKYIENGILPEGGSGQ